MGDTLYFKPQPSAAVTGYVRVYLVNGEATTIATAGPTYIPRVAHRLIAYKAAWLAAIAYEVNTAPFKELYAKRLETVRRVWAGRFQSKTRFVREGVRERMNVYPRNSELTDTDW